MGRHREFDPQVALEAAMGVFWQKGYEGTSFEDLTRVTGVARPGLYAAFGNKEALFHKALDLYEEKYLGFMREALANPNAYQGVCQILNGCIGLHTACEDHRGCFGINAALACSDNAESIRTLLIERRTAGENRLYKRLEKAQDDGQLGPEVDCAALATYIHTLCQGIAVQSKAGAKRQLLQGMVDIALEAWPGPRN